METPATFKSTPTKLTQSSITPSKASRNNFSGMSCCSKQHQKINSSRNTEKTTQ